MEKETNIPQQEKGNQTDTVHEITLPNQAEAKTLFEKARQRLLDVSCWGEIANGASSDFELIDSQGQKVNRPAQEGDHFKIHLPAPGPDSGNGSDWVQVKSIMEEHTADSQTISILVKPSVNPQIPEKETAHFFGDDASSTFLIRRNGNTISAEVHGRNEVPNIKRHGFWDTIRHTVVALGAIFGFSGYQWKNLTEGLIEPKKEG